MKSVFRGTLKVFSEAKNLFPKVFFALGIKTLSVPKTVGTYFWDEKWVLKNTFGDEKCFLRAPSANYLPSKHPTHPLAIVLTITITVAVAIRITMPTIGD